MISYELNTEEARLIDALRSGTPDEQGTMFSRACTAAWEKRDPMPQGDAPPAPIVKAEVADDLDETNYNEEIAHYLFGKLVISSVLTRQQVNGEMRQYVLEALTEGIDEVARMIDRSGYTGIEQLIEDAQWGRLHHKQGGEA